MPQIASEPQPCCQTSTIRPQAAPTDSRFSRTALSGMISERNARASSRNVSTRDQRDARAGSCRRRRRGSRRSGPPRRRSTASPAGRPRGSRSSVARPAGGVAVRGRDDGDQRRAVAAPVGRRDRRCGRRRRPASVGDDWRRVVRSGRACRTATAGRCRCPERLELVERRRGPGPAWASDSACGLPSWIVDAATTSAGEDGGRDDRRRPSGGGRRSAPRPSSRGWRGPRGALWRRSRRGPIVARTTGSSVIATATLTSGISMPAMPMLRRNGTGSDDERQQRDGDRRAAEDDGLARVLHGGHDRVVAGRRRAGAPRASGRRPAARSRSRSPGRPGRSRNLTITETSVALASGQTARNVVGIATSAISIGTNAIHEAKTKTRTSSAPPPAISASSSHARARRASPSSTVAARSASRPVTCTGAPPTVTSCDARPAPRAPRPGPGSTPPLAGM